MTCKPSQVYKSFPNLTYTGQVINTLWPRQNDRNVPDDIFKCISFNENVWISIEVPLKFVPKGSINNIPALVQIMAWCQSGDKPLSELMMVNLPTRICVTRPQWVNSSAPGVSIYDPNLVIFKHVLSIDICFLWNRMPQGPIRDFSLEYWTARNLC